MAKETGPRAKREQGSVGPVQPPQPTGEHDREFAPIAFNPDDLVQNPDRGLDYLNILRIIKGDFEDEPYASERRVWHFAEKEFEQDQNI